MTAYLNQSKDLYLFNTFITNNFEEVYLSQLVSKSFISFKYIRKLKKINLINILHSAFILHSELKLYMN